MFFYDPRRGCFSESADNPQNGFLRFVRSDKVDLNGERYLVYEVARYTTNAGWRNLGRVPVLARSPTQRRDALRNFKSGVSPL